MPRGGKRTGAGRRKGEAAKLLEALSTVVPEKGDDGKLFADRVLARINDVPKKIENAEDYALSLLFALDIQTRSYNFNRLLDRKFGKPIQQVKIGNPKGEKFEVDVSSARDKLIGALTR